MNIFYVDQLPIAAAHQLIDVHVRKMVIESAQMLANAYPMSRLAYRDCPRTQLKNPRRHSYFNHPCSVWVRSSQDNFQWLLEHAVGLCEEYNYRLGKTHFTRDFIGWCVAFPPDLPSRGLTPPARAFSKYPIKIEDIVEAYREFYRLDKVWDNKGRRMDRYTRRNRPGWFPLV